MEDKNELVFYHAFSSVGGFGPQKFGKLLSYFGSLQRAWNAGREEFLSANIGPATVENILEKRKRLDPEKLFFELEEEGIDLITQNHESYPTQLKELPSAPAVLYIRGNQDSLKSKSLAIVGSRKFTEYGSRATHGFSKELVRSGLAIVSGLALGIDAVAHRATLDAEGLTIAVLGTGIDDQTIYPRDNFNLAKDILASKPLLILDLSSQPGSRLNSTGKSLPPPDRFFLPSRPERIISSKTEPNWLTRQLIFWRI